MFSVVQYVERLVHGAMRTEQLVHNLMELKAPKACSVGTALKFNAVSLGCRTVLAMYMTPMFD